MSSTLTEGLLVSGAGIAVYPPGSTFGPRLLHDFEFVWIIDGHAKASYDKRNVDAPAGTVILGRPGMTDRYDWDPSRRTMQAYFHFSFDYSEPGWPPLNEWPLARSMASEDILRPLFRYVIGMAQNQTPAQVPLLEAAVTLMLRGFLGNQTAVALEPQKNLPPAVQKTLSAIRQALAHDPPLPITLTALAHAAHVSPEYLCRLFRRHLDLGPLECAGLARLERAASLLVRSNLQVRKIADIVGFASPYHFSNKFHKVYGLSPRDYRASMQSGFLITGNPVIQHLQIPMLDKPESGH